MISAYFVYVVSVDSGFGRGNPERSQRDLHLYSCNVVFC